MTFLFRCYLLFPRVMTRLFAWWRYLMRPLLRREHERVKQEYISGATVRVRDIDTSKVRVFMTKDFARRVGAGERKGEGNVIPLRPGLTIVGSIEDSLYRAREPWVVVDVVVESVDEWLNRFALPGSLARVSGLAIVRPIHERQIGHGVSMGGPVHIALPIQILEIVSREDAEAFLAHFADHEHPAS